MVAGKEINPWETPEGKVVWKTEAQYWSWLRGALRRLWADYPLRKVWKKNSLRPLTKDEKLSGKFHTSTKNIGQCSFCGEWMAGSKLECDHKVQSTGCTSKQTAEEFLWHCGGLVAEDFRLACKPCHKAQSYSQNRGISIEEAILDKKAIAWLANKSLNHQQFLIDKGYSKEDTSNVKKRRACYIEYLKSLN